jgi:hypothetical protein
MSFTPSGAKNSQTPTSIPPSAAAAPTAMWFTLACASWCVRLFFLEVEGDNIKEAMV